MLLSVEAALPLAKKRYAVVIDVFCDDSEGAKAMAVGGCIADFDTWQSFSPQWQALIDEWGLPYFHMTDFENRFEGYESWDDTVARPRLNELLKLIYDHNIQTFGTVVGRREFGRVMTPLAKQRCHGFYGYLGQACVELVHHNWGEIFASYGDAGDYASVNYYFEEGTRGFGKIREGWKRQRETLRWSDDICTQVPKAKSPPAQVADIVSYEIMKNFEVGTGKRQGVYRYPLTRLMRRFADYRVATGGYLRDDCRKLETDGYL